ncbi:MAG: DNA-3-methyladenine glycosylase I [Candidatus Gracilibacteria bacterium]|nr:DNA-3-methyladenine glycosylase I [Candidatus Gracilibacteria bacterium]
MHKSRCSWVTTDPLYIAYHDEEWGRELHDSQKLFELLCLEGQQAGLSWFTILKRRSGMREVYDGFDPEKLSCWTDSKIDSVSKDERIIRHRLKVEAVVKNAKAYLELTGKGINFSTWIWSFSPTQPIEYSEIYRTKSLESDSLSKALKKAGFNFCGSTICYAFMQACGMVDDHMEGCWRYQKNDNISR